MNGSLLKATLSLASACVFALAVTAAQADVIVAANSAAFGQGPIGIGCPQRKFGNDMLESHVGSVDIVWTKHDHAFETGPAIVHRDQFRCELRPTVRVTRVLDIWNNEGNVLRRRHVHR